MEKKKSFFERHPYVCYALYAGLLFAFNLFLRWWSGELDADEYLMSAINTLILTAGFVWGDRYRRKNLANKKKIDELLNNTTSLDLDCNQENREATSRAQEFPALSSWTSHPEFYK